MKTPTSEEWDDLITAFQEAYEKELEENKEMFFLKLIYYIDDVGAFKRLALKYLIQYGSREPFSSTLKRIIL